MAIIHPLTRVCFTAVAVVNGGVSVGTRTAVRAERVAADL